MNELLFIGNLGTGEIIIIAIIVLLLFGARRDVILGPPGRTSLDFISFYFSALCFRDRRVRRDALAVR